MENRFGAPASGTPEGSARREFELLLLLGGSRKAAVQLWLRKQRIYANAQQAAGRPATEAVRAHFKSASGWGDTNSLPSGGPPAQVERK